jgi:hypothetical protein
MFDQFSYEEYKILLGILKDKRENLTFSDIRDGDNPPRFFILRHDIDFSLSAALEMAHFEAEHSIHATYFLLLRSENYNLLSEKSCTIPRQLAALGHEVGLHYDVRAMYALREENISAQLKWEAEILSELTGNTICSIAMHNPSLYGDDPFAGDDYFINAYSPRFTKDIVYYSDSCGAWRDQAHDAFSRSEIPDKLQVLIHPFFWSNNPGNRWERLNKWVDERCQFFIDLQKEIREIWNSHGGVQEHERRLKKRYP